MVLQRPEATEVPQPVRTEGVWRRRWAQVSLRLPPRRIVDFGGPAGAESKDALGPSWRLFRDWTRDFTHGVLTDEDMNFLILAVQSLLLMTTLDSPYVSALRGGGLEKPQVRAALRRRLRGLVERMVVVQ